VKIPGEPTQLLAGRRPGSIGGAFALAAECKNVRGRLQSAPSQSREVPISPGLTATIASCSFAGSITRGRTSAAPPPSIEFGAVWEAGQQGQQGVEFLGSWQGEATADIATKATVRSAANIFRWSTAKFYRGGDALSTHRRLVMACYIRSPARY
jgi:hypothetical protein